MDIQKLKNNILFEDALKKIKVIYPRLSAHSRTAKIIKTIEKFAPCSWKTIQKEAFADVIAESNCTPDEWVNNYSYYGKDMMKKIEDYFVIRYKNPNNKKQMLYELNDFGRAFVYCFNHLYNPSKRKPNTKFNKFLALFNKTENDILKYSIVYEYYDDHKPHTWYKNIDEEHFITHRDATKIIEIYKYTRNKQDVSFLNNKLTVKSVFPDTYYKSITYIMEFK